LKGVSGENFIVPDINRNRSRRSSFKKNFQGWHAKKDAVRKDDVSKKTGQ
jgi:hypothetical protein